VMMMMGVSVVMVMMMIVVVVRHERKAMSAAHRLATGFEWRRISTQRRQDAKHSLAREFSAPQRLGVETPNGSQSEVVLESQHHLARPDFRRRDLTELCRPELRGGVDRIAENRMVENVLGFDANLDPPARPNVDVLH
jgi:hypothetical protein